MSNGDRHIATGNAKSLSRHKASVPKHKGQTKHSTKENIGNAYGWLYCFIDLRRSRRPHAQGGGRPCIEGSFFIIRSVPVRLRVCHLHFGRRDSRDPTIFRLICSRQPTSCQTVEASSKAEEQKPPFACDVVWLVEPCAAEA